MKVFANRRKILGQQLDNNSVVIIAAASEYPFTQGVNYPFHQDSNFYYLTGINQPNVCLVMIKQENKLSSIIFSKVSSPLEEIWHGITLSLAEIVSDYGVDDAYELNDYEQMVPELLSGISTLYLDQSRSHDAIQYLYDNIQQTDMQISNVQPFIAQMRLIKDSIEIDKMRRAVEISSSAHLNVMRAAKPGVYENALMGEFIGTCMKYGAQHQAYPPILAGGNNALTLHYTANDKQINNGDLLLIDAACEYNHYTADITRTYPINGKFTAEQAAIYDLVLDAQKAAIAVIKPGMEYSNIHDAAVKVLVSGLLDLGILQGDLESAIAQHTYKQFYPHSTGHWLGLDVHDVGQYAIDGHSVTLQEGMLLTVEPGLYIRSCKTVDSKWHNIGVRIEDDILVTDNGCEILSIDVPKERVEIEKLLTA